MSYQGTVFDRKSRQPLSGIAVSDGSSIVFTDEVGRFELEGWERCHIIYICELTLWHNDWFIPTKNHEGDYDFFITPVKTGQNFCFLNMGDSEIEHYTAEFLPFARDCVEKHHPAFFIHTGDLAGENGVKRHYLALNRETVGCPVRYAIGNHDFAGKAYGEELFERYYGPTWYSFDAGEIHFVALSIGFGDHQSGYARDDQWKWLKNDLARLSPDKRVIVYCHNICPDEKGFCPTVGSVTLDLRAAGLLAWINGHYHYHYLHEYDGVYHIQTALPDRGGIDSSVGGIRKVTIAGHRLSSEIIRNLPGEGKTSAFDWSVKLAGEIEYCTPVYEDGDVFIATNDDGYPKSCGIYRIDGTDGRIKWFLPTKNGFKNDIAYDGGRIFAQDTAGVLSCIDAQCGAVLWTTVSEMQWLGFTRTNVLIVGGLVIAGAQCHVFAYDKETGDRVWDTPIIRSDKSPSRMVYDEYRRQLICMPQWKGMYALDIETGEIKWQIGGSDMFFDTATPLVTEHAIYTVNLNKLQKIHPEKGEILLQVDAAVRMDVSGSPVMDGDTLYFPSASGGVVAADAETLEVKRYFGCGDARLFSSPYMNGPLQTAEPTPVICGGKLIFAASDGYVYIYDKITARRLAKIGTDAPVLSMPIVRDGFIITANYTGQVTKYRI